MKKSLLALAALGAFVGAAQAQSSVTVYGVLDIGYTQIASKTAAGVESKDALVNAGNLTTSRLGFRGVEDLGAGLSAGFVVEMGIAPTSPNLSGSSNNYYATTGLTTAGSTMDNRQAFLSLTQKGVGQGKIGRQYTMVHEVVGANTVGGANNVYGDVMYSGGNSTLVQTLAGRRDDNYTIRATNAVNLVTERIMGLQVSGQYAPNSREVDGTAVGQGYSGTNVAGVKLDYTFAKLNVQAASQNTRVKRDTDASAPAATYILDGSTIRLYAAGAFTALPAVKSNTVDTVATASYDFGVLKAYLGYISRTTTNEGNTVALPTQAVKKTGNQIGVKVPVTPAIELAATYSKSKFQNAPNAQSFGGNSYQLQGVYNLSKRTNLYAIYGAANQDTTTASGAAKDSQMAVGMRHSF